MELYIEELQFNIRAKVLAYAKGESDRIRLLGAAEARAVEAVGRY